MLKSLKYLSHLYLAFLVWLRRLRSQLTTQSTRAISAAIHTLLKLFHLLSCRGNRLVTKSGSPGGEHSVGAIQPELSPPPQSFLASVPGDTGTVPEVRIDLGTAEKGPVPDVTVKKKNEEANGYGSLRPTTPLVLEDFRINHSRIVLICLSHI